MRKPVTEEELLNGWLKHHNLTVKELIENEPELIKTPQWFLKYQVTQAQHDEWEKWAKELIRKRMKFTKWMIERGWWAVYLNIAPSIINEK